MFVFLIIRYLCQKRVQGNTVKIITSLVGGFRVWRDKVLAKEFFTEEYYKDNIVNKPTRNNFSDLEGIINDKLTVLQFAGWNSKKVAHWWCQCSCNDTRYFKVAATSLKNKITTSCGCNYKKNGGSYDIESTESANTKLNQNLEFLSFNGWNYPCTIKCLVCNKIKHMTKASDSARSYRCCDNTIESTMNENLKRYDYTYIGGSIAKCNHCGIECLNSSIFSKCSCQEIDSDSRVAAVYILQSSDEVFLKIGKSIEPYTRYYNINKSSTKSSGLDFKLKEIIWVASESLAYWLESLLHQTFKDFHVKDLKKFDGYNEVFQVSIDKVYQWIEDNRELLSNLRKPDYTVPTNTSIISDYKVDYSVECRGMWFPSKIKYCDYYGIPVSWFEDSLCFSNMNWFKIWKPLKQQYIQDFTLGRRNNQDWGDGYVGNIRSLARKYGHEKGNIWHRINVLGLSMKEALALPIDNPLNYWLINNKYYNKKSLCDTLGVTKEAICNRMLAGTPFMYAIIPDRWCVCSKKDRIFNLNGERFWWSDLIHLFGKTENYGEVVEAYGCVKNYLLLEGLISEGDYFEEITWKHTPYKQRVQAS